jgi:hypothetical protein
MEYLKVLYQHFSGGTNEKPQKPDVNAKQEC